MAILEDRLQKSQLGAIGCTLIPFIFVALSYSKGNHIVSDLLFYIGCIAIVGRFIYYKIAISRITDATYLNFCFKNLVVMLFVVLWMPFAIIANFFNDMTVHYHLFLMLLVEISIFCFIFWLFFDKERYENYSRLHSVNINGNHIEQVQLTHFSAGYSLDNFPFLRKPLKLLTGFGKLILFIFMMLGGGAGIVINQILKTTVLQGTEIESGAIIFFIMGFIIIPLVIYCLLPLFTSIRWWESLKMEIIAKYGSVEVTLNLIEPKRELSDEQEELDFIRREKERVKEEKKKARKTRDEKIYDWLNK